MAVEGTLAFSIMRVLRRDVDVSEVSNMTGTSEIQQLNALYLITV